MPRSSEAIIPEPARAFMALFLSAAALALVMVISAFAALISVLVFNAGAFILNLMFVVGKLVLPVAVLGLIMISGVLWFSRTHKSRAA